MALTKKQISEFKEILIEMKQRHTRALKGTSENVKTEAKVGGSSQHHADEGSDDYDRTISLEVSGEEINVIRQIDHALTKIENGTYGICDVTEKSIPLKRLEAIPYAAMTVEAQEMVEKGEV
jgi:DnaK suppressor protein